MSQDVPSNRKGKKALRDAERQKKGRKRKLAETVEPEQDEQQQPELEKDFVPLDTGSSAVTGDLLAVKAPKSKKRKEREDDAQDAKAAAAGDATTNSAAAKLKKRKKVKQEGGDSTDDAAAGEEAVKKRNDRFVVFIGNLPYNTTDASVQAHFKKLEPFTLRHRVDPKTKKSKGFAFLEFENYDRMKTCLKLYHHSMFDPEDYKTEEEKAASKANDRGRGKKAGGRRINVELTAGGGGKKEGRMEKIKVKNVRLEEQRKRRSEQEMKEKARSDRKGRAAKKQQAPKQEEVHAAGVEGDTAGMHPSRLAMMKR